MGCSLSGRCRGGVGGGGVLGGGRERRGGGDGGWADLSDFDFSAHVSIVFRALPCLAFALPCLICCSL